jgi:hypothetical protein
MDLFQSVFAVVFLDVNVNLLGRRMGWVWISCILKVDGIA